MCGIIGLYGDDLNVNTNDKKQFIIEGAIADTVRGYEATGIFNVAKTPKHDPHRIYKRALAGYDFVQLKQFNKVVDQMHNSIAMVVHNRASTRGHGGVDSNAHPFKFGDITLVHNGTVSNAFQLVSLKDRPDLHVDSAAVAHAFNHESADDMLPRLQGGYSLVWHDASDNTLHFARNDAKPMFLAFDANRQVVYFGSEVKMILWLADRNGIQIQDQIFSLTPHVHYIFKNPKKVREIEKRPFDLGRKSPIVVVPPSSSTRTPTHRGTPWEPTKETPPSTTTSPTPSTNTTGLITSTTDDNTEVPKSEILKEIVSARVAEVLGLPIPDAKVDRLNQLKDHMKKRGLELSKPIKCVPRQWTPYSTKIREGSELVGVMNCYKQDDIHRKPIFQVFGVTQEEWNKDFRNTTVDLEPVNFREKADYAADGGVVFVCRLEGEGPKQKHSKSAKEGKDVLVEVGTANKRKVTVQWYRAATADGCCNCGGALPLHLANTILWIGEEDNVPMCDHCSCNETIIAAWAHVH